MYTAKYLKYKKKYLDLKNRMLMHGGKSAMSNRNKSKKTAPAKGPADCGCGNYEPLTADERTDLLTAYKNSNEKNTYLFTLKSFNQQSDKMIVSDPSYEYNPKEHEKNSKLWKLNVVIDNVLSGEWKIMLGVRHSKPDNNAFIECIHEDYFKDIRKYKWEKIFDIGVDSGQAGIYDMKYYGDDKQAPKSKDKTQLSAWYQMNSSVTGKATDYAGPIPHGAVSMSGYGDGMYPVYVAKNKDKQVIGVKIIFIDPVEQHSPKPENRANSSPNSSPNSSSERFKWPKKSK